MKWTLYHYDKAGQRDQYWMLLDEEGKAVIYSPRPGVLMTEFAREADAFAWFRPSENIGQAWDVVEKMRAHGYWTITDCGNHWDVVHQRGADAEPIGARCESLPLAICRAALKAAQS